MEEILDLRNSRILIIGLGLMGGSLALALKGKCREVIGLDIDPNTQRVVTEQKIVDQVFSEASSNLNKIDVIILATPVNLILQYLQELPAILDPDKQYIILDLGSTKVEITKAMANLPANFDPIGCHPICGKENQSIMAAERTLYFGAPFFVCNLPRTSTRATTFIAQLVELLGTKFTNIEPELHDLAFANVSHLPYLISSALAMTTPEIMRSYIGPGFKSSSRLAGTSSSMMLSVIASNRENILHNLEAITDEINYLTSLIADRDQDALKEYLDSSRQNYQKIIGKD